MALQVKFPFGRGHGPLHTCGTCGFMTRHRAMYDRHHKNCSGTPSVGQMAAGNASPTPSESSTSADLPSPPVCRNYRCEKCGFATSKSRGYLNHRREAHGENFSIYPCDQCEYASRHKSKVIRHRGLVHKNVPEDPDFPYECDTGRDSSEFGSREPTPTNFSPMMPKQASSAAMYQAGYLEEEMDEAGEDEEALDENQNTPVKKNPNEEYTPFNSSPEDIESSPNATRIPDPTEDPYDYITSKVDDIGSVSYMCRLCSYGNQHKWKIATHIRAVHMRKTLFKCPYCEFVTERKIEWCVHKTQHTEKIVHACKECSYRTTMKRNFERHLAHHSLGGPFKCSLCSYSSSGEAAVQRHMAEYHPSPDKRLAIDSIHSSTNILPQQQQPVKKELPMTSVTRLAAHPPALALSRNQSVKKRTVTMSRAGPTSGLEAQCSICHIWFKNETRLRIHMVSHSNVAPYSCPVCSLCYKRQADLNRHMKRKHGTKIEDYRHTPSLQPTISAQHQSSLSEQDEDQPLDLCVIKKNDNDNESVGSDPDQPLDLSMKPPAGSTIYRPHEMKCTHCSYMAKWPSDLRRHMLVHSIEKRFRCIHCNKKYKYQFDLNMHLRKAHRISCGKTRVSSAAAFGRAPAQQEIHKEKSEVVPVVPVKVEEVIREQVRQKESALMAAYYGTEQPQSEENDEDHFHAEAEEDDQEEDMDLEGKPFLCLFCSYRSSWKGDMKQHLVKHHGTEVEKYGELPELVNLCFKSTGGVDVNSVMPAEEVEEKMDEDEEEPERPVREYPDMSDFQVDCEGKILYQCPRCPMKYDFPSKLKNHMEIHENIKKFMCPHCGKRSNWQWDIRKHITNSHPNKPTDVIALSEEDARVTINEYMKTRGKSPMKSVNVEEKKPEEVIPEGVQGLEDYARVMNLDIIEPEAPVEVPYKKPHSLLDSIPGGARSLNLGPAPAISSRSNVNSLIATVAAGRYRRFKCSKCGKRSNWKWDIKKHIRANHPSATMIELSEEQAKETFHEVLQVKPKGSDEELDPDDETWRQRSPGRKPGPKSAARSKYRPFKCSWCGKRSNWKWDLKKHLLSCDPRAAMTTLSEEEAKATFSAECQVPPAHIRRYQMSTPEKVYSQESTTMAKVKKYKCSICPYRSDYRSDISRHLKRKHRNTKGKILVLGAEYAASTLNKYKENWVKKKFVISANKMEEMDQEVADEELENCIRVVDVDPDTGDEEPAQVNDDVTENSDVSSDDIRSTPTPDSRVSTSSVDMSLIHNKIWQCTVCDFKSRNKMTVIDHFRGHGTGHPFKCKLCGYVSDYRGSIYRHVKQKHQRKDYQEVITYMALREVEDDGTHVTPDKVFMSPPLPMDVTPKQEPCESPEVGGQLIRMFQCRMCPSKTVHKHNLVRHIKEKHPEVENPHESLDVVEGVSTKTVEARRLMQNPTATTKDGTRILKCTVCPFQTVKQGLLSIHVQYHEPKDNDSLKCKYCPYYVCTKRRLRKHMKLHQDQEEGSPTITPPSPAPRALPTPSPGRSSSGKAKHFCDKCPYISINKNDFIYHKQFHRPRPAAPFKCEFCPYWVSLRRLLTQHEKVHTVQYKIQYYPREMLYKEGVLTIPEGPQGSPTKSVTSGWSVESNDVVEVAGLKQQIISSKVTSVPITPEKLTTSALMDRADSELMKGYMVDDDGIVTGHKSYRKIHQCRYCPYKNVRSTNLRLHEKMHGRVKKVKDLFQCVYCDYSVGNKGLLAHHMVVHSSQYRPEITEINDVEPMDEDEEFLEDKSGEENEENNNIATHLFPERMPLKTDPQSHLQIGELPGKSQYYIKMDSTVRGPVLEKAVLKKWCCDRCPYGTKKKTQFERHVLLHGSKQKYPCEFCDYSVPGYHMLVQHKKLHLLPNNNLLNVQSIGNLQSLPEVPADIAAAAANDSDSDDIKNGIHDSMMFYENSSEFVEPKKLYRCDRCPYTNNRRDHLLSHLKFHMINSDLRCPYCDYSVSKVHLLNQHIKVHFSTPGTEMSSQPKEEKLDQPEFFTALRLKQKAKPVEDFKVLSEVEVPNVKDDIKVKEQDKDVQQDKKDVPEQNGKVSRSPTPQKQEDSVVDLSPVYKTPPQEQPMALVMSRKPDTVRRPSQNGVDSSDEEDNLIIDERQELDIQPMEIFNEVQDLSMKSSSREVDKANRRSPSLDSKTVDLRCRFCDRRFWSLDRMILHEEHHLVGERF